MKVVIIAAGMGSRLWTTSNGIPKTLLPFGDGTILSSIIESFKSIGINEFIIVTGYKSEMLTSYTREQNYFSVSIECIENKDWQRGNGLSVLKARPHVKDESFILSMSDHIVSVGALKKLHTDPSKKNLLLIDTRLNEIFDIDDATKVLTRGKKIIHIGKNLRSYNAIDCGIFRLTEQFFNAMTEQARANKESISEGIQHLIKQDDMEAVIMDNNHHWLDLDTPEAYLHGMENIAVFT